MSAGQEAFSRFEFKYLLDPVMYLRVRDFIDSIGLFPDENTPENPYSVTSLYFDTFGLDDYYDKAAGLLSRKKVRIRTYAGSFNGETREVFFEVKNKYDMFIAKERAVVSGRQWRDIVAGDFEGFSPLFDYHVTREGRVPTALVRYRREAFEDWFEGRVRLTFDRQIETARPDELSAESGPYSWVSVSGEDTVLEIKFAKRLPWWFSLMLERFDLARTAYSKYARSVDVLYCYDPLPR